MIHATHPGPAWIASAVPGRLAAGMAAGGGTVPRFIRHLPPRI